MADNRMLAETPLFKGSTPDEVGGMLGCLGARERGYAAGERIFRMGESIREVGLVLEGAIRIENVDVWGNVSVLGASGPGQLFGEAYAAVPGEPLMVDVVAAQDSRIMFLTVAKVLTTCPHACPNHARASANLAEMLAGQALALSRRIFHVAPKTMRGKILAYLSYEAERAGAREFDIPYDRQQLADYLGVDRSALSAELSRMAREGILETRRSHFVLLGGAR